MNLYHSNRIKQLIEQWLEHVENTVNQEIFDTEFNFSEETILITGAAGTIGSGLTKRLLNHPFKSLVLIDNAESQLYFLKKACERSMIAEVHFVVADVRDAYTMQHLFELYKPTIVFHTAAYKHVSMMESHPYEAIKLNILATKQLAHLAIEQKVKKFIFISTDKAVHPIGVMGMTKRIGEVYLAALNKLGSTQFLITRFGNIIGSNGSLLPLFYKQIKEGLPLTITSEKVTRYFIQEAKACELIQKIADESDWKYHMFTFHMGKPIKIIDLAKIFLELTSSEVSSTLKIIGLKPGEKMHEDLKSEHEVLIPTHSEDIIYVKNKNKMPLNAINIEPLEALMTTYKTPEQIKTILKKVLKEI
jgi:FlaA1/EpsC-like NDP-sugar epimerase